jgi:hypothetical protein
MEGGGSKADDDGSEPPSSAIIEKVHNGIDVAFPPLPRGKDFAR